MLDLLLTTAGGAFLVFAVALAILVDRREASEAGAEPGEAGSVGRPALRPGQPPPGGRHLHLVAD